MRANNTTLSMQLLIKAIAVQITTKTKFTTKNYKQQLPRKRQITINVR